MNYDLIQKVSYRARVAQIPDSLQRRLLSGTLERFCVFLLINLPYLCPKFSKKASLVPEKRQLEYEEKGKDAT